MRGILPSDHILLIVQGKENLGDVLEIINVGIDWEELIPNQEEKVQEGTELDCPEMSCALGVIAKTEAEVETKLE